MTLRRHPPDESPWPGRTAVTTIASGLDTPYYIASDATSVYWSTVTGGAVWRVTPK